MIQIISDLPDVQTILMSIIMASWITDGYSDSQSSSFKLNINEISKGFSNETPDMFDEDSTFNYVNR